MSIRRFTKTILKKNLSNKQLIFFKKFYIKFIDRLSIVAFYPFLPHVLKLDNNVSNNPKIGFAILSYERPEYLEICLDTLFNTNLYEYDITFLIQDDGSSDPLVKEIINKKRNPKYKIIRYFNAKGHNSWGAAFNKAMKSLLDIDNFDIIGSCDSDALFHPEWLHKTLQIAIWAKNNEKKYSLSHFSSFNSSDADFHRVLEKRNTPFGDYLVKKRMGALNTLIFTNDFKKLGFYSESKDDETLMTQKFLKLGVRYFCTDKSYIEHIGHLSILNQWRPTPVKSAVYGLNLVSNGWGPELTKVATLGYYKFVKKSQTYNIKTKSNIKVDILIPTIEKDLFTLDFVLDSINKNFFHDIGNIFLISPESNSILALCDKYNCKHIIEDDLGLVNKDNIQYFVNGVNRTGWIYQQLIKLSADSICNENYIFVLDSDTILTSPQIFQINSKSTLLCSDEFHIPYFETFYKLFGYKAQSSISFVSHQIFFKRERLIEMKNEIEKRHNMPWYNAVISVLDKNEASSFSEYETYANWMLINYPDELNIEYYFNKTSFSTDVSKVLNNLSSEIRSCSFHSYNRS